MTIIAALDRNGIIGVNGDMPWRIPSDFAHFKRATMGKPMIMGRKQFETVGKPLPGRTNIVVSRQQGYQPDGVIVINDFKAAIFHAKEIALADGVDEIMIIGGGEIYEMAIKIADKMIISHVVLDVENSSTDTVIKFPHIDLHKWHITKDLPVLPDERDQAAYSIKVYLNRNTPPH
ncbi:Dihydrofolate reductase [hydrothermal vent metagenome]|uniref:dihydrofolate reductase n=1 Tax=hydrothermal vent metagenome TaxID=652676 RepID=A0A3B0TTY4_9ZZZZ